ncbi:hypothetical protein MSPP1_000755 [Malassezia sp. CBS 17886]|nr:hypothetical protein MSPP1_000755 [Malassezia sp. CBS 17886]
MDPILYKKNTILQRQRILQNDTRPVYLRARGSKALYGTFLAIFWTGVAGVSVGCYNMTQNTDSTVQNKTA